MSFPRYAEYKDSGVEWLGEVPAHWEVKRLKQSCEVFPSNVDKKSYDNEEPVRLCNYTDVYYNDFITNDLLFMEATASLDQIEKFRLKSGDTIVTKDSETADDIGISAYVHDDLPQVVCGYHLSMIRPRQDMAGLFVKRLFDSNFIKAQLAVLANGLTRVGLSQYAIDNLLVTLPPVEEQFEITAFLERETGKIDALVAEQEKLITLLKEKRQAVISHAVTKGLDPTALMRDSGIEWLGEVPKHWDIVRLKRLTVLQRGHDLPAEAREEGDVPIVSSGGISGTHSVAQATAPGVVTGRYGTIGEFLYVNRDYWPLNTALYTVNMYENNARYVWYTLQSISEHFTLNSLKSAVPGVDRNDVHTVFVPRSPVPSQAEIAEFLDQETAKLDALTAEAQRGIDLLKERRSALISAVVTGKIDVRELVKEVQPLAELVPA